MHPDFEKMKGKRVRVPVPKSHSNKQIDDEFLRNLSNLVTKVFWNSVLCAKNDFGGIIDLILSERVP